MKAALKGQTDRLFMTERQIKFNEVYNDIVKSRNKDRSAQMKITGKLTRFERGRTIKTKAISSASPQDGAVTVANEQFMMASMILRTDKRTMCKRQIVATYMRLF